MNNRAKKATAWATGAVAGVSSSLAFPALAFAAEERTGLAVILPDMNEFIPMLEEARLIHHLDLHVVRCADAVSREPLELRSYEIRFTETGCILDRILSVEE